MAYLLNLVKCKIFAYTSVMLVNVSYLRLFKIHPSYLVTSLLLSLNE